MLRAVAWTPTCHSLVHSRAVSNAEKFQWRVNHPEPRMAQYQSLNNNVPFSSAYFVGYSLAAGMVSLIVAQHHLREFSPVRVSEQIDALSDRRIMLSELCTVHQHASYRASSTVGTLCEPSSWQYCTQNDVDFVKEELHCGENRVA